MQAYGSAETEPAAAPRDALTGPLALCRRALEQMDEGDFPLEIGAKLSEVIALLENVVEGDATRG